LLVVVFLAAPLFAASNAVPFVNQPLVPSSIAPGSAGLTLTVNGAGFVTGAVVNWNGFPLATTFVNHDRLKAIVPAANVAKPGTATVTVTNPAPGGGASNAVPFTATVPTASLSFSSSVLGVGLSPASIVAADFNNDGKADLAILDLEQPDSCYTFGGAGVIQLLLGNGAGGFTTASATCFENSLGTEGAPNLAAADFNGDGKLDLAAGWYSRGDGSKNLATFLGNGSGGFTAADSDVESLDGVGPVAIADFNRDGKLDIANAVTDVDFPGIFVFLGNGNGTFTFGDSFGPLGATAEDEALATGDFNGDGILDLAVTSTGPPGEVTILLGNGDGTFTAAATQPVTTMVFPQSVTTGDFNGDGILDLAFADTGSTALTVLLGNGDGTFTQKDGQPDAGQTTSFITTADFNSDGKLDLVLVDSANAILIYLGNGDGTFQTALETAVGAGPSQLAFGDFNSDGRLDIAVANSGDNTVTLLLQAAAATLSRESVAFGNQPVGTASPSQRVTLTNKGSARLAIESIIASGDFSQTNNCGSSLPIGRSCHIYIVFTPTEDGLRTGSITITDDAPESPQVIALSGTGT
jgi:hypothetical protein